MAKADVAPNPDPFEDEEGWETTSESATNVNFDKDGDQFTGTYQGESDEFQGSDGPFRNYLFRSVGTTDIVDGELCSVSQSYTVRQGMASAKVGDLVRLTRVREVPTRRGQNPMKDIKVQIKRAN